MNKEIEKMCKCCYRIKTTLGLNYRVLLQDRWLATFEYYSDANNFIDAHINADYEEKKRWTEASNKSNEPLKVQIVKSEDN